MLQKQSNVVVFVPGAHEWFMSVHDLKVSHPAQSGEEGRLAASPHYS
jgi:hypothetical protein